MAFIAAAAPLIGEIGAGISAASAVVGGIAASNNASYQAAVANNNALIANNNAKYAMEAGSQKAQETSMKGAAQAGLIKTAQAANGVDVNSGSNSAVQTSQREESSLDTQQTEHNAALQAYGYRTQAANYTAQAGLDTAQANEAVPGAVIGAAGSLLSDASSLSFKWGGGGGSSGSNSYSDYNQTGLPGNGVA